MLVVNPRPIVVLTVLLAASSICGCSTTRRPPVGAAPLVDGLTTGPPEVSEADRDAAIAARRHAEIDSAFPRDQEVVGAYQISMRPTVERALRRGSKYLPAMKTTLREEGVPAEFAYGVPIVESGYSLHATSHAGAVGPWQFIRGTGKRYGLRIDGYVDERRDPEKATRAAARYLRDLYDRFGDWHLALAAYNTGEGNIERIKSKRGCESFWEMRDGGYLPNETSEYVPKVLAAMEVAQSAKQLGIDVPKMAAPRFDTIEITRPISLKAVAQLTGSDLDTIKELNPALRRGVVPPDGYTVRLPEGTSDQFQVAFASYREPIPEPVRFAPSRRSGAHTVRRGDTLGRIAGRYGVSTQALMRANGIRRPKALRTGQRLQIPGKAGGARVVASKPGRSQRGAVSASKRRGRPVAIAAQNKPGRPSSASRRSTVSGKPRVVAPAKTSKRVTAPAKSTKRVTAPAKTVKRAAAPPKRRK